MPRYAAFLRAVNVGGTGKLPMAQLKEICEGQGFTNVVTYIASGNVAFDTLLSATESEVKLTQALAVVMGKAVGVFVRDGAFLSAVIAQNPFAQMPGNRQQIIITDATVSAQDIATAKHLGDEEIALGEGIVYIHYPNGMGQSKLRVPALDTATGRNLNTIMKMRELVL